MKIVLILLIAGIFLKNSFAQSVIEPVNKPVYDFLERMNNNGILESLPVMKPYTQGDIVNYILKIDEKRHILKKVETEELEWYKKEYLVDNISTLNFSESLFNTENRFRFFYFRDSTMADFTFYATPVISYNIAANDANTLKKSFWGFNSFGSVDKLGFRIDFTENTLKGNNILRNDYYSDEQGRIISSSKNEQLQFSNTNGSLTYQNTFMTVGVLKENLNFGEGYKSQLILSDKAPSFPALYFKLDPLSWFQFYFIHGWLNSSVIDSSRSYSTDFNTREIEQEKYLVLHAFQISPIDNLSFTLGETIVYSDRSIYLGYFIPFLFYRSVDHAFTHGGADSGNNGSFFGSINFRPFNNLGLYSSIFIDEIGIAKLLRGDTDRNQFGYTAGIKSNIGIENFFLTVEYTKILPWVYSNWIPSQTYTNSTFLLGHYIGQNSDQIFTNIDYRIGRSLLLSIWGEYIRRGGTSEVENQYTIPGEPFLYGLRRNDLQLGLNIRYEFIHDLIAKLDYTYSNITDEDLTRTPDWQLGVKHTIGFILQYGL